MFNQFGTPLVTDKINLNFLGGGGFWQNTRLGNSYQRQYKDDASLVNAARKKTRG